VTIWARKGAGFEEEAAADREYWQTLFTPDTRVALMRDLVDDWERMNKRPPSKNRDYPDFLTALVRREVRFVVIGAHAFAHHVKPRYTKDLDVFVDSEEANVIRLLQAVDDFGFGSLGFQPADLRPGLWIQLGVAPHRIDVSASISGVTFEEAWQSRSAGDFEGVPVYFLGREALIRNKAASGRHQDLSDLEDLQRSDK
jgi:hypothetical protein